MELRPYYRLSSSRPVNVSIFVSRLSNADDGSCEINDAFANHLLLQPPSYPATLWHLPKMAMLEWSRHFLTHYPYLYAVVLALRNYFYDYCYYFDGIPWYLCGAGWFHTFTQAGQALRVAPADVIWYPREVYLFLVVLVVLSALSCIFIKFFKTILVVRAVSRKLDPL